jgi:hypothetical protein
MLSKNALPMGVITALALQGFAASQFYEIRGVQDGVDLKTGARPLRQNIEDIQKDPYTWYVVLYIYKFRQRIKLGAYLEAERKNAKLLYRPLFILALSALQNSTDHLSYFQICGKHRIRYKSTVEQDSYRALSTMQLVMHTSRYPWETICCLEQRPRAGRLFNRVLHSQFDLIPELA